MACLGMGKPSNKILDQYTLKAFAGDKINDGQKKGFCFRKDRKHCGKRRKCLLSSFSPFRTTFSKCIFVQKQVWY